MELEVAPPLGLRVRVRRQLWQFLEAQGPVVVIEDHVRGNAQR